MLKRPEDIWPVDSEFSESYASKVAVGSQTANGLDAVIVGIARNAMPCLPNTLGLIDELHGRFNDCRLYIFENDSEDETPAVLDAFAATRQWVTVEHDTLGGIDSRGFDKERTRRLAACRIRCQEWVRRNASATAWTIVLDLDPEFGFSVDGVMNSIAWLGSLQGHASSFAAGAMASYSLYRRTDEDGTVGLAQYDSWAARIGSFRDRKEECGFGWFSMLLPPVGSAPIPLLSAFGGLCVYMTRAYLAGQYDGEDCEHVGLHRSMRRAGWQLYLNPGCRYVAIWQ